MAEQQSRMRCGRDERVAAAGARRRAGPRRAPGRPGPAILLPRRRPGHLGPLHVTQLLLAEAVLVAVLPPRSPTSPAVALVVAVAGAVLLLLRARPPPGPLVAGAAADGTRRTSGAAGAPPPGRTATTPRLAALRTLAPGLVVENVAVADGAQVGVARDDAGWYAVAALTPTAPTRDDPGGVPLDVLAAALADADQPGAVLQVVTQTVPAPSIDTHPSSPAGQSYRQLLARFGAAPVPADRETWVAVRLDARSLAEAVAGGGADLDAAPAVVAALVRRVAKSLRHVGVAHRLLDADALLGVLRPLVRPGAVDPTDGARRSRARSGPRGTRRGLAHRSFWIRGWPPVDQAVGAARLAVHRARGDDQRRADHGAGRATTRWSTCAAWYAWPRPPATWTRSARRWSAAREQARAELFPLDGEQGPAVYASAPTGGGAR